MTTLRERARKFLDGLLGESTETAPKTTPESYEVTYAWCADFLLQHLHEKAPPFDHNEWHLASVEIPSDWEDIFELICWMNALAVFAFLVAERKSEKDCLGVIDALVERLRIVSIKASPRPSQSEYLVTLFVAILKANPLEPEDPVFQREDTREWSGHTTIFGRAKAVLDHVVIEDRHKAEALSRLGRCMIYATHCASTRFGAIVPKIHFIDDAPLA